SAVMSGTGFGASNVVTIKFNCFAANCSSTQVLATPTTDAAGNFGPTNVVIPTGQAIGTHYMAGHDASGALAVDTYSITGASGRVGASPSGPTDPNAVLNPQPPAGWLPPTPGDGVTP